MQVPLKQGWAINDFNVPQVSVIFGCAIIGKERMNMTINFNPAATQIVFVLLFLL